MWLFTREELSTYDRANSKDDEDEASKEFSETFTDPPNLLETDHGVLGSKSNEWLSGGALLQLNEFGCRLVLLRPEVRIVWVLRDVVVMCVVSGLDVMFLVVDIILCDGTTWAYLCVCHPERGDLWLRLLLLRGLERKV